jgi:hypothetical protein
MKIPFAQQTQPRLDPFIELTNYYPSYDRSIFIRIGDIVRIVQHPKTEDYPERTSIVCADGTNLLVTEYPKFIDALISPKHGQTPI